MVPHPERLFPAASQFVCMSELLGSVCFGPEELEQEGQWGMQASGEAHGDKGQAGSVQLLHVRDKVRNFPMPSFCTLN